MKRGKWVLAAVAVAAVTGYAYLGTGDSGVAGSCRTGEPSVHESASYGPCPASRFCGVSSPIELDLALIGANQFGGEDSGGEVIVDVSMKPLIDSRDIRWFVKVPEGLSLISGPGSWEGQVGKGEEKKFQLTFSVPDGGRYELYSRAEADMANGDVVTKGAGLQIDLGPEEKGDYPPFERTDSEGRGIISYKGRSEEGGQ